MELAPEDFASASRCAQFPREGKPNVCPRTLAVKSLVSGMQIIENATKGVMRPLSRMSEKVQVVVRNGWDLSPSGATTVIITVRVRWDSPVKSRVRESHPSLYNALAIHRYVQSTTTDTLRQG